MSTKNPEAVHDTVRMFQTHDVKGNPKTSETVHPIESKFNMSTASQTMAFLDSFTLIRTNELGLYGYTDPKTGSGQLRLEGFGRSVTAEIDDLILTREVEHEIGQRDPFSPYSGTHMRAYIIRSNNPYYLIILGLAGMGVGIYSCVRAFYADTQALTWTGWIIGLLITIVCLVLVLRSAHRAVWWMKARKTAMRIAGRIPSNLKGL